MRCTSTTSMGIIADNERRERFNDNFTFTNRIYP
jgi:hypothetical protein